MKPVYQVSVFIILNCLTYAKLAIRHWIVLLLHHIR